MTAKSKPLPLPRKGEVWLAEVGRNRYAIGRIERVDGYRVHGMWRDVEGNNWHHSWCLLEELIAQVMTP